MMTFRLTDNNRCLFLHSDGKRLSYPPKGFTRPDLYRVSEHIIRTHTPWCIKKGGGYENIPAPSVGEQDNYFPKPLSPWDKYKDTKLSEEEIERIKKQIDKEDFRQSVETAKMITHPMGRDELLINNKIGDYLWARTLLDKGQVKFDLEGNYKYKKFRTLKKNGIVLTCRSTNNNFPNRRVGFVNIFEFYEEIEKFIVEKHIKTKRRSDIYSQREREIINKMKNRTPLSEPNETKRLA